MSRMRVFLMRWLLPVFGGAVALALVFVLYRELDLLRFLDGLRRADLGWISVLAATILLEQFANGWKWRQLLYDVKPISSFRLTGAMLAGYGANALVPLGISPLVRAWLIARLETLKMATVLSTTIVARFVDGVVFALFAGFAALAGRVPQVEGNVQLGLSLAGAFNLALFGGLLWTMFRFRRSFARTEPLVSRLFDKIAGWLRANGASLREALTDGVIWPASPARRAAVVVAAFAAKLVATTHFLWSGLAVGVVLAPFDYLFLMVFAGFALVLASFIRVPGGFVIGSAYALSLLGVPDEAALLMILFNHMLSVLLMVGVGLVILWRSGVDIRQAARAASA